MGEGAPRLHLEDKDKDTDKEKTVQSDKTQCNIKCPRKKNFVHGQYFKKSVFGEFRCPSNKTIRWARVRSILMQPTFPIADLNHQKMTWCQQFGVQHLSK